MICSNMDEYLEDGSNFATSKLNSGWLINKRLDELWRDAYKACKNSLFINWDIILDSIWSELGGEYDDDSPEMQEFERINSQLTNLKNWSFNNPGFKCIVLEEQKEKIKQYKLIRKKEMFLRRIQNKQGKGTAYSDGSEDDWE